MPAQLTRALTGFAHFETEVLLPNETQNQVINQMLVFNQAVLTDNVLDGLGRYTIRYTTATLDYVEKILSAAKADGTPKIRFRVGYGEPQKIVWKPWRTTLLIKHDNMPVNIGDQAGHMVEMLTADDLFTAGRANKTVARKGTVANMVATIADENGLSAVIEATQGTYTIIQNFIDDTSFIRERLLPRATSTSGHGNYLFFVRDGVLHFHSPDYQSDYVEFRYYESSGVSMGQADVGQMLIDAGASGTVLIAYDPYSGQAREAESDPTKALRLADGIFRLDKIPGMALNIPYHIGANGPAEAVSIGQNKYERARLETQRINMHIDKIIDLRAGDFINLVVAPSSKRTSTCSGLWLVSETNYTIKAGTIGLIAELVRGEVTQNLSNTVAALPNLQLVPEQNAPGRDLNVRQVQSSEQTVGAEKETSSTGLRRVLDANKLPV